MIGQVLWQVWAHVQFAALVVNEFVPLGWIVFVAVESGLLYALYRLLKSGR